MTTANVGLANNTWEQKNAFGDHGSSAVSSHVCQYTPPVHTKKRTVLAQIQTQRAQRHFKLPAKILSKSDQSFTSYSANTTRAITREPFDRLRPNTTQKVPNAVPNQPAKFRPNRISPSQVIERTDILK